MNECHVELGDVFRVAVIDGIGRTHHFDARRIIRVVWSEDGPTELDLYEWAANDGEQ